MYNYYRDEHGIHLYQSFSCVETFDAYRMKLARCNTPVILKTGDQAQEFRELVHGMKLADKHLGEKDE